MLFQPQMAVAAALQLAAIKEVWGLSGGFCQQRRHYTLPAAVGMDGQLSKEPPRMVESVS